MNPILYRYRETESVIKQMDGYTPGEGWEPLYSQAQFDQLQAQLVRQQASYEAEIKVEIDAALERAALKCDEIKAVYSARYVAASAKTPNNLDFLDGASDGAEECAAAVRALKESNHDQRSV
jgi:hypothetical protein